MQIIGQILQKITKHGSVTPNLGNWGNLKTAGQKVLRHGDNQEFQAGGRLEERKIGMVDIPRILSLGHDLYGCQHL